MCFVLQLLELDYQPHQIGPLDGEELHGRNDWDSDLTKQVRLQKSDKHKEKWSAATHASVFMISCFVDFCSG